MLVSRVSKLLSASIFTSVMVLSVAPAQAQVTHGITAVVNDDIVTTHDLRQRVLFIFATTGANRTEESLSRIQSQALKNLVDEKIQLQESDKYEQEISPDEVDQAVARLLGRNGLDPNEVVQRLAQVGISINTLRDQVRSEIAWQRIVNGLYGSRIRISDAQIDETLARLTANASQPSYRVAEIYIEATEDIGGMDGAMEGARAMIAQVEQGAPFPLLAQQFSSSPSAAQGGDIGFIREGELRPELNEALLSMDVGELSQPIQVPGGVYVLALVEKQVSEAETLYALKQAYVLVNSEEDRPAAKTRLESVRNQLTSCDTLEDTVDTLDNVDMADMGELRSSDISEEVLASLSGVAEGSTTEVMDTPSSVATVMVCSREVTGTNIPTRDEVENRLMDQQLAQASKRHLRDLRRKATIVVR